MSTYPVPKLLSLWEHGEISAEQMIGYLAQHVEEVQQEVKVLRQRVSQLEAMPATSRAGQTVAARSGAGKA